MNLLISNGSLYKNRPKINCPVGATKKIILAGPSPDSSDPLTNKNKGITVIGPAKIKIILKFIFSSENATS